MRSGQDMKFPPLGLAILASLIPDSYEVEIRDANYDEIKYENCDLVGISAMTCQALSAYEIAKMY